MGIAGAALYSLALLGFRAVAHVGPVGSAMRLSHRVWQSLLAAAALYGASCRGMPPAAHQPWNGLDVRRGTGPGRRRLTS